jgi:hypothetical protein
MSSDKKHALVFGASGISGWSILNQALTYPTPTTFSHITGLTNRPLTPRRRLSPFRPPSPARQRRRPHQLRLERRILPESQSQERRIHHPRLLYRLHCRRRLPNRQADQHVHPRRRGPRHRTTRAQPAVRHPPDRRQGLRRRVPRQSHHQPAPSAKTTLASPNHTTTTSSTTRRSTSSRPYRPASRGPSPRSARTSSSASSRPPTS